MDGVELIPNTSERMFVRQKRWENSHIRCVADDLRQSNELYLESAEPREFGVLASNRCYSLA